MSNATWSSLTKKEAQDIWNSLSGAEKDVLVQLTKVTWDGGVASKSGRDGLWSRGLITRYEGFQIINPHGLILLADLGKLEKFVV